MKIYTKTGDAGKTSLLGGTRVAKYDLRIEAYGTVDELNAHVGAVRSTGVGDDVTDMLLTVHDELIFETPISEVEPLAELKADSPESIYYPRDTHWTEAGGRCEPTSDRCPGRLCCQSDQYPTGPLI